MPDDQKNGLIYLLLSVLAGVLVLLAMRYFGFSLLVSMVPAGFTTAMVSFVLVSLVNRDSDGDGKS